MKKQDLKPKRTRRIPNDQAPYFFHQGTNMRAFDYLGAHRVGNRFVFRVWAPNADYVSVCGDFTDWRTDLLPMWRVTENGVWEVSVESIRVGEGDLYKFFIRNGSRELYKADPYATRSELPPGTASVICDLDGYEWRDAGWLDYRREHFTRELAHRQPINIYELHAGSWRRHADGRCLSFGELAAEHHARCVDVNRAVAYAMTHLPYDLWGDDHAHTSRYGAYLAVCTFYATLFGKTATELGIAYGLPAADAKALQEAADQIALQGVIPWEE